MAKPKVLFLCTGNSCRSQMAEAWLRHLAGDRFEVFSAGTAPKPIHPYTFKVMAEAGVDMTGQSSKLVNDLVISGELDYLITVCDEADKNCPVGLVKTKHRLHWFFEDPASVPGSEADRLEKFREIRDLIQTRIQEWISEE
jgi:arsenate reductase